VNVFVSILESRIINFLFRIGLSSSLFKIKILLKNGFIKVNNKVIKNINYYLLPGDIVTYENSLREKIISKSRIFFSKRFSLMFYPSSYIEISFPLLNFLYYKNPTIEDVPFSFNINFKRILSFYNYKGLR
jgi:ribosomal protein S4